MDILNRSAEGQSPTHPGLSRRVADQIEAQTKPPRIPEPMGLGAVVGDEGGNQWIRVGDGPAPWMLVGASPSNRDTYAWDSLRPTIARSQGTKDGAL